MKITHVTRRRYFFAVVYALWLLVLAFLVLTGEYRNYLHPMFVYSLWFAFGSLLLFSAMELSKADGALMNKRFALRGGILILPLIALWTSYGSSLDSAAYMMREVTAPYSPRLNNIVGRSSGKQRIFVPASRRRLKKEASQAQENLKKSIIGEPSKTRGVVVSRQSLTVTLLDLMQQPEEFDGKLIVTEGPAISRDTVNKRMHKRDPNVIDALPENTFSLYRFYIVCCVADCRALAALVNSPDAGKIEDNYWYRITGRFETSKSDLGIVGVIEDATVEKMTMAPKNPYLYDLRPPSIFLQHPSGQPPP